MPVTFYSRLKHYQKSKDSLQFSKTKLRKMSGCIKNVWDKRAQRAQLVYVKSEEGDFEVRGYPDSFIPTIDGIILKFHLAAKFAQKRPRKRIPLKTPVYSTRKAG